MCELTEEEMPVAAPVKQAKFLPYLILAGIFAIGLLVYFSVPLQT